MNGPREDRPIPIPQFPTSASEVPELATVAELLDAYSWHLSLAVGGRQPGAGPDGLHARHALAALAIADAIIDTFEVERWPLVRDALARGAAADLVGRALGELEASEILAGLASWAEREHRAGAMSLDDYDAVIALIGGAL